MLDSIRRHPRTTALTIAGLMLLNAFVNDGQTAHLVTSGLIALWFAIDAGGCRRCA